MLFKGGSGSPALRFVGGDQAVMDPPLRQADHPLRRTELRGLLTSVLGPRPNRKRQGVLNPKLHCSGLNAEVLPPCTVEEAGHHQAGDQDEQATENGDRQQRVQDIVFNGILRKRPVNTFVKVRDQTE